MSESTDDTYLLKYTKQIFDLQKNENELLDDFDLEKEEYIQINNTCTFKDLHTHANTESVSRVWATYIQLLLNYADTTDEFEMPYLVTRSYTELEYSILKQTEQLNKLPTPYIIWCTRSCDKFQYILVENEKIMTNIENYKTILDIECTNIEYRNEYGLVIYLFKKMGFPFSSMNQYLNTYIQEFRKRMVVDIILHIPTPYKSYC
jgi:hypothetical protein